MIDPPMPERGKMVLYDRLDVALPLGEYTLALSTDVSLSGAVLPTSERHFNVEGPQFTLAPTEVAGVFPPRNARGEFSDALPHIALGRRTLPWERSADPKNRLPPIPKKPSDPPAPSGSAPWLALLLFDETETPEARVLTNVAIGDVLPAFVLADLQAPSDVHCDAIEVSASLLRKLMPTLEELHLLCHARQVNTEDRELSAGDSDGWFGVVMSNRVPIDGRKYRACLVSVEGRTDLIATAEPAIETGNVIVIPPGGGVFEARLADAAESPGVLTEAVAANAVIDASVSFLPQDFVIYDPPARLVLLHSWTFECEGQGTFQQLAEHLDVGMIGEVRGDWPKVTDTGHMTVDARDRAGSLATAWYRGPLVPLPITRDNRGPYHSADQARRVSAETGMEDISYAVAFEVGRLLAASDARLAQELMRWRRGDFRVSLSKLQLGRLRAVLGTTLDRFPVEQVAARLLDVWGDPRVPSIDPYELSSIAAAPGLNPERLAQAWGVSAARATQILSAQVAALSVAIEASSLSPDTSVSLETVAADTVSLERLRDTRNASLELGSGFDANGFEIGAGLRNGGFR